MNLYVFTIALLACTANGTTLTSPHAVEPASPERLGKILMAEILPSLAHTSVGQSIANRFVAAPIPVHLLVPDPRLNRVQPHQVALYDSTYDLIDFNATLFDIPIARIEQIKTDPIIRTRIAQVLEGTALHELKHWHTRHLIGDIASLENETEAHHVQVLLMLERLQENPDYLRQLPPLFADRAIPLLQSWLKSPEAMITEYLAPCYLKTPSLFTAHPKQQQAETELDLNRWRERRDHYDEQLAQLRGKFAEAKELESTLAPDFMHAGSHNARSHTLARTVATFPTHDAVDHVIAQLEDALAFWKDETRLAANQKYYANTWSRIQGEWRQWTQDHPNYKLPLPPTPLQKFLSFFGKTRRQ